MMPMRPAWQKCITVPAAKRQEQRSSSQSEPAWARPCSVISTLLPNTELGHLHLHGKIAEQVASAAVRTELNLSYREWAKRFDDYLHRLEELFWPDLFIIGGEISKEHARFFPHLTIKTRVLPAALRNDAGIIGAAIAVLRRDQD